MSTSQRMVKYSTGLTVLLAAIFVLTSASLLAATGASIGEQALVNQMAEQIALLKWLGGAVVAGLVTTIGVLYRSVEKSNTMARTELLSGMAKREEILKHAIEQGAAVKTSIILLKDEVHDLATHLRDGVPKGE